MSIEQTEGQLTSDGATRSLCSCARFDQTWSSDKNRSWLVGFGLCCSCHKPRSLHRPATRGWQQARSKSKAEGDHSLLTASSHLLKPHRAEALPSMPHTWSRDTPVRPPGACQGTVAGATIQAESASRSGEYGFESELERRKYGRANSWSVQNRLVPVSNVAEDTRAHCERVRWSADPQLESTQRSFDTTFGLRPCLGSSQLVLCLESPGSLRWESWVPRRHPCPRWASSQSAARTGN